MMANSISGDSPGVTGFHEVDVSGWLPKLFIAHSIEASYSSNVLVFCLGFEKVTLDGFCFLGLVTSV